MGSMASRFLAFLVEDQLDLMVEMLFKGLLWWGFLLWDTMVYTWNHPVQAAACIVTGLLMSAFMFEVVVLRKKTQKERRVV